MDSFRIAMLLQRHAQLERPFNVLSLDTEDSDGETYVWCVYGHYQGKIISRVFTSPQSVVRFLFQRRWPHTFLTGKNLDYDLNTLKYKGGFNWGCIYNMGQLITGSPSKKQKKKFHLQNKHIKILELGNWILNRSLKKICTDFGIEGHIDKHILHRDGNIEEMTEACMSHARCGVEALEFIQKQIHSIGGNMKLTAAATALNLFMTRHLDPKHQIFDLKFATKHQLRLFPEPKQAIANIKDMGDRCRYGGRTENFIRGFKNNVDCVDVVSQYPHVMKTGVFPDIDSYLPAPPSIKTIKKIMDRFEGYACVEIESPGLLIPFLPIKQKGKLIFPNGVFQGWYTFPALRKALALGYKIKEVYEVATFKPMTGFFTSYIDECFALKSDPATKHVGKLMLNGLSGKMGQKKSDGSGFSLYEGEDIVDIDNKTFFNFRDLVYQYTPRDNDSPPESVHTAYPIISAYITDLAREYLYDQMQKIGFESIYYTDTDSIHADSDAIKAAIAKGDLEINKSKLGCWSYEYQNAFIQIRGLKYYRFREPGKKWQYKMKGVPASHHRQYWEARKGWFNRVRKIKTSIRNKKPLNEFYDSFRHDMNPTPKRVFKGNTSIAIEV